MGFSEWVGNAFDGLTPDHDGIYESAAKYSIAEWKATQKTLVTGSGALASGVPGLHLVGIGADVVFLMNRMAVCSYGLGAIIGKSSGHGNFLESEDFAVVLARWGGDDSVSDAAIGKVCADLMGKVGGKGVSKVLAKTAAEKGGILLGKKLAGKVGAKVGVKFGAKLGTKAAAGWFPLLGAAVGGGINLWFITEIASSAESWYRIKAAQGGD
jgi:hypothetical protein